MLIEHMTSYAEIRQNGVFIMDEKKVSKNPWGISDEKAERLAAATLEFYYRFMERPDARELLEKRKAELRKRGIL